MTCIDDAGITGEIRVQTFDAAQVHHRYPEWPAVPRKRARLEAMQPESEARSMNAIQDEFLEHIPVVLDPKKRSVAHAISHFGVGRDGTAATSDDGGLLDEVHRAELEVYEQNGAGFLASGVLDSNEANGQTLREAGLSTGSSTDDAAVPVNRGVISETPKTESKIVTIDFDVSIQDI